MLRVRRVHSEFFACKAGLSLHFTNSKSECPRYPPMGGAGGFK